MEILTLLRLLLNVTSSVLAAITAYLYFWLPNVQNSHGTCVFHFSLNVALMHAALILYTITTGISRIFRQYCMTEERQPSLGTSGGISETIVNSGKYEDANAHVLFSVLSVYVVSFLVASVHVWSVILSYNTWKQVKQIRQVISQVYPTRGLNWFLLLGYGVSILYVVFIICHRIMNGSFIFYHPVSIFSARDCSIKIGFGKVLFSLVSILLNIFYFANSQRRLLKLSTDDVTLVPDERCIPRSHMTKLKYKICLNLKLCLTMNIPIGLNSLMFVIVAIIKHNNYNSLLLDLLLKIHFFLASLQGTFFFLVAVALRKPVIKSFIEHRRKSCLGWIRIPEYLMRPSTNDGESDDETGKYLKKETGVTSLQSL